MTFGREDRPSSARPDDATLADAGIGREAVIVDSRESKLFWGLTAPLFFVACSLAFFVLSLTAPFGTVLIGTASFSLDAVLNAGILEWGHRRLFSGRLFEWTAGFPLSNTLAGTENLIGWQLFYSPLRWIGIGVAAAYNVLLIWSFIVSALGAALLAQRLGAERWGACAAGLVFAFTPFHLNQAVHIQTMAVCWSPFAVFSLDRLLQRPRVGDWIGLVAAYTMSLLSGMYVGIFLAGVLVCYAVLAWAVGRARFRWRTAGILAFAGGTALLLTLPVLLHYIRFNALHGLSHSVAILTLGSLRLIDLTKVPAWVAIWQGTWITRDAGVAAAFPGLVGLALIGCFVKWRTREPSAPERHLGLLLGSMVVVALLFALGPVLKLRGDYPSRIAEWVPLPGRLFTLVSAIRFPMRTMLYVFLFGGTLAGLGLSAFLGRLDRRQRRVAGAIVLGLLLTEYWPARWYSSRARRIPPPIALSSAYAFLAKETDRGGVVELPQADSTGNRTPMNTRYTYGSSGHLRRVVAFHGSVRPAVLDTLEASAERLPESEALHTLTAHGVTRLVVHFELMSGAAAARIMDALSRHGYEELYRGNDAAVIALRPDVAPVSKRAEARPP